MPPTWEELRDQVDLLRFSLSMHTGAEMCRQASAVFASNAAAHEEALDLKGTLEAERQAKQNDAYAWDTALKAEQAARAEADEKARAAEEKARAAEEKARAAEKKAAAAEKKAAEKRAAVKKEADAKICRPDFDPTTDARLRNLARPRFAFLVGVGHTNKRGNELANPTNDVEDVGTRLTSLGFHCMTLINEIATVDNVRANFEKFVECIGKADSKIIEVGAKPDLSLALFFFSGHGGTDAEHSQTLVCYDGDLQLNYILSQMAKRQVLKGADRKEHMPANFVLLDCCRNDRSSKQRIHEVDNTCILFSCRSVQLSSDGVPGRNGLFTKHLLWNLATGLELPHHELIHNIKAGVARESQRKQVPLETNCISEVAPIVLVENPSHLKSREYIEVAELLDTRSIWKVFAGWWARTAERLWFQATQRLGSMVPGFNAVRSAMSRIVRTENQGVQDNDVEMDAVLRC